MKIPAFARSLTRSAVGVGRAQSLSPTELQALAAREPVVVIGVGVLRPGAIDDRLPGTQRVASLLTLSRVVADLPRQQPIALHCG